MGEITRVEEWRKESEEQSEKSRKRKALRENELMDVC